MKVLYYCVQINVVSPAASRSIITHSKDTKWLFYTSVLKKAIRGNCCGGIINSRFNCNLFMLLLVVDDGVFIVPGIQGLFSPFMGSLSCPVIFDCLQRLCQQSLGLECTMCIWSFYLNQSCATKCCLNAWLAYCGCSNHRACLLASHGYLKLTRSGTMRQSEVTHIVMQWPSFSLLLLSLCVYLTFFFHFSSTTTSLHPLRLCTVGRRCMPVPRWRGGGNQ